MFFLYIKCSLHYISRTVNGTALYMLFRKYQIYVSKTKVTCKSNKAIPFMVWCALYIIYPVP